MLLLLLFYFYVWIQISPDFTRDLLFLFLFCSFVSIFRKYIFFRLNCHWHSWLEENMCMRYNEWIMWESVWKKFCHTRLHILHRTQYQIPCKNISFQWRKFQYLWFCCCYSRIIISHKTIVFSQWTIEL